MELILASSSARRLDLLTQAGYTFQVCDPEDVEARTCRPTGSAARLARVLALAKARSVAQRHDFHSETLVLGADTTVALNNHIIGKARNRAHARQILTMLSGTTHQVITALALLELPLGRSLVEHDVTSVTMAQLSAEQIQQYLQTNLWQGKAGAYAIQEDDAFILKIDGSFSNVVGLPLELLERMLRNFLPTQSVQELKQ